MASEKLVPYILSGLSERQQDAVTYTKGPLLIVAGPGSGKTRVMAHRLGYLVAEKGVPPHRILAVTFTNKAARELRERCETLIPQTSTELRVFTFHGFCSSILRSDGQGLGLSPDFTIYDSDDQTRLVRRVLKDMDIDPTDFKPKSLLSAISLSKNKNISPDTFMKQADTYREEVAGRVFKNYEENLEKANAVDFDDLLLKVCHLMEKNAALRLNYQKQYKHILVDEFQDTNPLQFQLAKLLSDKHQNICVVGDPDQSIYSWRHAAPNNLLDFQKTFTNTKTITLDQSYRSTEIILEAADSVIANNESRVEKHLWTNNERGDRISVIETYDEEDEAKFVINEINKLTAAGETLISEIAVMYRINAQSRSIEVACNREGLAYRLVGGIRFYERKEIKDLISFLRVVSNPSDNIALERIINVPARGISARTISELRKTCIAHDVSLMDMIVAVANKEQIFDVKLNKRAINAISMFADLFKKWIEQSLHLSLQDLIDLILEDSGYLRKLKEDTDNGDEKIENLREFRGSSEEFSGKDPRKQLSSFLENVSLISDVDNIQSGNPIRNKATTQDEKAITLITLHQAKGLEFDTVFITGVEEGLLPHSRSLEDQVQLEEERRLFYVGMTRAKKRLFASHAFQRRVRGSLMPSLASRFLSEIPKKLIMVKQFERYLGKGKQNLQSVNSSKTKTDFGWSKTVKSKHFEERLLSKQSNFTAGDKVHHDHFGDGVVISTLPRSEDIEIMIAFGDGNGVRRLLASLAPIRKTSTKSEDDNNKSESQSYESLEPS